ncbi:Uncharacterized protein ABC855_g221 [[Candida] zeylanoides]
MPGSSELNNINLLSEVILRAESADPHINETPVPPQLRNIRDGAAAADSEEEPFSYTEIESEPETRLRSDIQSNEHLLLSSARLNPTNTNTLVSGGVSLRRSNAIRARGPRDALPPPYARSAAYGPPRLLSPHGASRARVPSASEVRWHAKSMKAVAADLARRSVASPIVSARHRHHPPRGVDEGMDAARRQRLWRCQSRAPARGKRRAEPARWPCKRQRHGPRPACPAGPEGAAGAASAVGPGFGPSWGTEIDPARFSAHQWRTLTSMPSSFVAGGRRFALGPHRLDLSHVGQGAPRRVYGALHGDSRLVEFLVGDMRVARSKEVARKLAVLEPRMGQLGRVSVALAGEVVDFCSNDLRFLPAPTTRTGTMVQVAEWAKIAPFSHLQEALLRREALDTYRALKSHLRASVALDAPADAAHGAARVANAGHRRELVNVARSVAYAYNTAGGAPPPASPPKRKRERDYGNLADGCFNERLVSRLTEFVACEDHCLVNLSLNYVLFFLVVDVAEMLDGMLARVGAAAAAPVGGPPAAATSSGSTPATTATLLCSIDRKTGALAVHNTRPYLEYTNACACDSLDFAGDVSESVLSGISLRTASSDDEFDVYEGLGIERAPPQRAGDPYLEERQTTLAGHMLPGYAAASAV